MITKKRSINRKTLSSITYKKTLGKGSNNIKILSYNISWESTSGKKTSWPLCSNNTNPNNPKHYTVCIMNISKVITDNPVDFITLQEASDYKKLMNEAQVLKTMNHITHSSGLDFMVTFWNKKYKLQKTVKGEFETGRPWMACLFTNGICLINVHFGHYDQQGEISMITTMLEKVISSISNSVKRVIISGDFNYNIKDLWKNNLGKKNMLDIPIPNNNLGLKLHFHEKHILTCCVARRRHYDHVLDSKSSPLDIQIPNVNYMASDHKPIIVTLVK